MFRRIATAALAAGLAGGLLLTAVQSLKVLPLIMQAEVYEAAAGRGASPAQAHESGAQGSGAAVAAEGDEAWAPADGIERFALTAFGNVLAGVGFALLLCAAASLRGGLDWREGLLWGLGGYAAFNLAPALGLPPELPGMRSADIVERQTWWVLTAAATAGGLALIAFVPRAALKAFGAVLIVVPHLIGAPHPMIHGPSVAPAELEALFVSATLVANLLFWLSIGSVAGLMLRRSTANRIRLSDRGGGVMKRAIFAGTSFAVLALVAQHALAHGGHPPEVGVADHVAWHLLLYGVPVTAAAATGVFAWRRMRRRLSRHR